MNKKQFWEKFSGSYIILRAPCSICEKELSYINGEKVLTITQYNKKSKEWNNSIICKDCFLEE